jgi:hypothetical protein
MGWGHLKIFFSRITEPEWVIFTLKAFCYNVNSELFTSWSPGVGRGHNRENHIYMCLNKKKISPEPARPISIKLYINHSLIKGISYSSNKGPDLLQKGDNHKMRKFGKVIEFFFPWEPLAHNSSYMYLHESFNSDIVQILWSPRVKVGDKRGNYFYICILERIF